MNTPREPNVRTRSAHGLDQARGWMRQRSAPSVQRPVLALHPKAIRNVDHAGAPTEVTDTTDESKPVT